jgi:hypothetical protein
MLRRDSIENADILDDLFQLHFGHLIDVMAGESLLMDYIQADERRCGRE